MKFYRVKAAIPFLVTSKAAARRAAGPRGSWQECVIPTDKAGLLEWANDVLAAHQMQLETVRLEVKDAVSDFYRVVKSDNTAARKSMDQLIAEVTQSVIKAVRPQIQTQVRESLKQP